MEKLKYKVCGYDQTVDEKGNAVLALRKIQWGIDQDDEEDPEKVKLELRKWYINASGETPGKGVTFLTEEGPHDLTQTLVDSGYGHTEDVLKSLMKREDFVDSCKHLSDDEIEDLSSEEYYDARTMLGEILNEQESAA